MNRNPTGRASADSREPPGEPENPGRTIDDTVGSVSSDPVLEQLQEELGQELKVLRHIGDELFGSLYLARERLLPRFVVVKVLRPEFVDNVGARLRFERAARSAAGVSHPNVVTVLKVDKLRSGVPYFVEGYVGECTLRERQKAVGRLDPGAVRQIVVQLADALAAVHRNGIVHRDLRPDTVRCEDDSDRVLLADFGIAGILKPIDEQSITAPDEILGSPPYMSPEQRETRRVTDRSDIYSLGVLTWELLAGSQARLPVASEPIDSGTLATVAPDDPDLIDLVRRCLRDNPHERPTAADLLRELQPVPGRPVPGGWSWRNMVPRALRQRRIPQIVGPYVAGASLSLGVVALLYENEFVPRLVLEEALVLTVGGLFAVAVIAWYHGARGPQPTTWVERLLIAGIAAAWLAASIIVWQSA